MNSKNDPTEVEARLQALIGRAFACGDLPKDLLEVSTKDVEALDPARVARLKSLVKSGDHDALKHAMETLAAPLAGFNRGVQSEPDDVGLDEARDRVRKRVKRKLDDPDSPPAPTESR